MKKLFYVIVITTILLLSAYTLAQGNIPGTDKSNIGNFSQTEKIITYAPGEIIVKFKESKINLETSKGKSSAQSFTVNKGLETIDSIKESNVSLMKISGSESVEQKIIQLQYDPNVEYAEPNYLHHIDSIDSFNDTHKGLLRGLAQISGYEAFEIFSGNSDTSITGTIVAVLDLGVAYDHPDLVNQMRDGTNCKDENGATIIGGCIHGYDFVDEDNDPYPMNHSHGTHIAGTIAAEANNNKGILGVNFNARIMAIKAGDANGLATWDIIQGTDFATQNGAKIINASYGGSSFSQAEYDAVNRFRSAGGLFVAAAGNSADNHAITHHYPCDFDLDNIICVAATSGDDTMTYFSDYGAISVDVGAPGIYIYSSVANFPETTAMFENFESIATGTIPSGRSTGGVGDNVWGVEDISGEVYDLSGNWSHVLYGDINNLPYANNVDSTIATGIDISNASGITIDFWAMCDTEYSLISWTDYMALEVSADGITWAEVDRWDEPYLDSDTNPTGSAYYHLVYDIAYHQYMTDTFTLRFRWHSNASDNNYNGCLVDDVTITAYTANTTAESYASWAGTSMATPHVVGLASLAWSMRPDLSYTEIKQAIMDNGDSLATLSGKTVSGKRINAYKTLIALDNTLPTATVTYSTTGWTSGDVVATITGFSETVTGIAPTDITFTGNGSGEFIFFDLAGNTGTATAIVTWIDKIAPTITFTSHISGAQVTGSTITLTGILNDESDVSLQINGSSISGTASRTKTETLTGGINLFVITGTDSAGNTTTTGITIIRVNYLSDISDTILSGTSVKISFTTDIDAQEFVNYGTSSGSLITNIAGSTTGTSHTITIDGLLANTTYYYQVYGISNGYTGEISSLQSFQTLSVADINTINDTTITTGSVYISGSTSTGVIFTSTGTLIVTNTGNANNYLQLDLSGFIIETSGGTWDGVLMPPVSGTKPTLGIGGLPASSTNNGSTTTTRTVLLTMQAGSDTDSLIASGGYFTLNFVVTAGTSGDTIYLYRSADNTTWTGNTPQTTCMLNTNKVCNFTTDHLSYFSTIKETTTNNPASPSGGGGGVSIATCVSSNLICTASGYVLKTGANCQGGDLGKTCTMKNTGTGSLRQIDDLLENNTSGSIIGSPFSLELNLAYIYAYRIGITTMPNILQANMTGTLIRKHLAKMISNFAIKELKKTPNTGMICDFTDLNDETIEMKFYANLACQLGLIGLDSDGVPTSIFNPDNDVTRAQFGTVLSRALRGDQYNSGEPFYILHLSALQRAGIMNLIDTPKNQELRGRVMLMLMRSVE